MRHTTVASRLSQFLSQTVPHFPLCNTSTLPRLLFDRHEPLTRRTVISRQRYKNQKKDHSENTKQPSVSIKSSQLILKK